MATPKRQNYFLKRQYGNEKRRIVKTKNSRREVSAYDLRLDYKRRENFSLALFLLFSDFWLSITGIEVKSEGAAEGFSPLRFGNQPKNKRNLKNRRFFNYEKITFMLIVARLRRMLVCGVHQEGY